MHRYLTPLSILALAGAIFFHGNQTAQAQDEPKAAAKCRIITLTGAGHSAMEGQAASIAADYDHFDMATLDENRVMVCGW